MDLVLPFLIVSCIVNSVRMANAGDRVELLNARNTESFNRNYILNSNTSSKLPAVMISYYI